MDTMNEPPETGATRPATGHHARPVKVRNDLIEAACMIVGGALGGVIGVVAGFGATSLVAIAVIGSVAGKFAYRAAT